MGAHQLQPPAPRRDAVATVMLLRNPLFLALPLPLLRYFNSCLHPQAVDITSCGNFAVVGSSSGRVDVYNMQSGLHRGCYGDGGTGK